MLKTTGNEQLVIPCAEYLKDYLWVEDNGDYGKTVHIRAHEEDEYATSISLDKDRAAQLIAYLEEFFDLGTKRDAAGSAMSKEKGKMLDKGKKK